MVMIMMMINLSTFCWLPRYPDYAYDTIKTLHEPVYSALCKNFLMFMMQKKVQGKLL